MLSLKALLGGPCVIKRNALLTASIQADHAPPPKSSNLVLRNWVPPTVTLRDQVPPNGYLDIWYVIVFVVQVFSS